MVSTGKKVAALLQMLPGIRNQHETYELTARRLDFKDVKVSIPDDYKIEPLSLQYLNEVTDLLDLALSHTFEKPTATPFHHRQEINKESWMKLATNRKFDILLIDGVVAGACIVKGAEIDDLAILPKLQG